MSVPTIIALVALGITILGNMAVLVWHTAVVKTTVGVQGKHLERISNNQERIVNQLSELEGRVSVLEHRWEVS